MNTSYCRSIQQTIERLTHLGFWQVGSASFASDKCRLELDQTWSTFEIKRPGRMTDPLSGQVGTHGPWKRITRGGRCRLVADVPTQVLRDQCDPDIDDENGTMESIVEWLMHSSSGGSFDTWQPPDLDEIESWQGPEKLTVVAGAYVRQGTLQRASGRLSVRIPLVPVIPPQLPKSRWNWLRAVLVDDQNRHRAARIGLVGEPSQQSIVAEIDLSGAPAGALPALFTSSLAALKHTVQWSIHTLGFLVDLDVECRALEVRRHPSA
jgi:hypothetical protein